MKEIEIRDKDRNKMRALNAANQYFIRYSELLELVDKYKKAKDAGKDYQCALIEYRLTDINFHTEVSMLASGKYTDLIKRIKKEMNSAIK